MLKKIIAAAIIILIIGVGVNLISEHVFGFGINSKQSTENQETVEMEKADTAEVNLKLAVGQVTINGGATALMEGEFQYDDKSLTPQVEYREKNGHGTLNVTEKKQRKLFQLNFFDFSFFRKNTGSTWDIALNDTIPLKLSVDAGVGETNLQLADLHLTALDIQTGVGETTIDLTGEYADSFDVYIETGVGETEIVLPENAGVMVEVEKGIGSLNANGFIKDNNRYKNDVYDTAEVQINVFLESGIGDVTIRQGK
ncbi:Cell wall-active antibiotics response 4TMS YvqF [Evansella caseinilytica]|uniref:Cell wall-active antibiotics response 4TMS YvqF n=1 Tax=Evansella caseinilytica TaxID=1503961 RepID=A0A1H3ULE0_9BACI|nr:toast rack family protein [Evansella caseinilytica]SDZ63262.1 Cell wall-active antibiotics response 4TMS YvqF [Evansella caseinilytica]